MSQPQWRKPPIHVDAPPQAKGLHTCDPDAPAVLFVCTANRIRSPLAQYLWLDMLSRRSNPDVYWRVESAGIWAHEGLPVLEPVYRAGLNYGLDLSTHRARSVAAVAIQQYDLILTMERLHTVTLCNEFPQLCGRVMTLGEAVGGYESDIADPPHHTARAVRATATELANLLTQGFVTLYTGIEALSKQRRVRALQR